MLCSSDGQIKFSEAQNSCIKKTVHYFNLPSSPLGSHLVVVSMNTNMNQSAYQINTKVSLNSCLFWCLISVDFLMFVGLLQKKQP